MKTIFKAILAGSVALAALAAQPAFAGDHDKWDRDKWDRGHSWKYDRHDDWRHDNRRYVVYNRPQPRTIVTYRNYVPYPSPIVYYYPQPVYYGTPGYTSTSFSFSF